MGKLSPSSEEQAYHLSLPGRARMQVKKWQSHDPKGQGRRAKWSDSSKRGGLVEWRAETPGQGVVVPAETTFTVR